MFSSPLEQIQKTIDELFGRYIPASPKLKKKPKNLDFWKQTWYNTKRKIRKACLQPQTGGFRQASLVTFSGCSAVGSARGLGPRCRRFESCHSDQNFDRKQSLFSTFGHFLCLFKCFTATFEKSHFYDHIIKYGLKIPFSLFTAAQNLKAKRATAADFSVAVLYTPYAVCPALSRSFSAAISAFFYSSRRVFSRILHGCRRRY